jgi:hypothetical protein
MKFDIAAVKSSGSTQGDQYIKAHGNYQWHDQLLVFSVNIMYINYVSYLICFISDF